MAGEEKNAEEALRRREAEAAEAATADAIAAAATSLGLTPPPSPGFVADVSAVVEADEASRSTAPAKRSRPSIEQTFHTYVGDLDEANRDFDNELGGLEIEGEDDSKIRRLMVQMQNMKDDFRSIIANQAKTMDEALKSEHTANEIKVDALNAAIEAAENEKQEFKSKAEAKLDLQRADFQSEKLMLQRKFDEVKADTERQVEALKRNWASSEMKLSKLVPTYTASKQALDAQDQFSLETVAGHVLNGGYSKNLYTEQRYQHKINKDAPFEPQHEPGPQLDAFFASLRFPLVGKQRRQRSYYEVVYGKPFQDDYEQDMMDYIDKHKDYDKAGYKRDDDFHWAYLPMSDGMTAVKCGGTFRAHCVRTLNQLQIKHPKGRQFDKEGAGDYFIGARQCTLTPLEWEINDMEMQFSLMHWIAPRSLKQAGEADVVPETTGFQDRLTYHPEILAINQIALSGQAGPGILNFLEVKLTEILNATTDEEDIVNIRRLIRQIDMQWPHIHLAMVVEKLQVYINKYVLLTGDKTTGLTEVENIALNVAKDSLVAHCKFQQPSWLASSQDQGEINFYRACYELQELHRNKSIYEAAMKGRDETSFSIEMRTLRAMSEWNLFVSHVRSLQKRTKLAFSGVSQDIVSLHTELNAPSPLDAQFHGSDTDSIDEDAQIELGLYTANSRQNRSSSGGKLWTPGQSKRVFNSPSSFADRKFDPAPRRSKGPSAHPRFNPDRRAPRKPGDERRSQGFQWRPQNAEEMAKSFRQIRAEVWPDSKLRGLSNDEYLTLLRKIRMLGSYVKRQDEQGSSALFSSAQSASKMIHKLNETLSSVENYGKAAFAVMSDQNNDEALLTSNWISDIASKPDAFELAKEALFTKEDAPSPSDNGGNDDDFLHEEGDT